MAHTSNSIANEYDYLVFITEQCIKKGFDFESCNTQSMYEETDEISKLHNFVLRVALLDAEILSLLCDFEKKFWETSIESEDSYKDLIEFHLNHKNVYVLNLN